MRFRVCSLLECFIWSVVVDVLLLVAAAMVHLQAMSAREQRSYLDDIKKVMIVLMLANVSVVCL